MVRGGVAVSEGLIKREVWKLQATQWRVDVVACVNAYGAVIDVYAVATKASPERQKRRGRMAEHAGLAAIVFVKIHVA